MTANGGAEAPLGRVYGGLAFLVLAAGDDRHHIHSHRRSEG